MGNPATKFVRAYDRGIITLHEAAYKIVSEAVEHSVAELAAELPAQFLAELALIAQHGISRIDPIAFAHVREGELGPRVAHMETGIANWRAWFAEQE